jgi:hypothetical protein
METAGFKTSGFRAKKKREKTAARPSGFLKIGRPAFLVWKNGGADEIQIKHRQQSINRLVSLSKKQRQEPTCFGINLEFLPG